MNLKTLESKYSKEALSKLIKNEISIMKELRHDNIVKLHEALEDEASQKIYLVMDYCSRGALLSDQYWRTEAVGKGKEMKTMLLNFNKGVGYSKAKEYIRQAAEALFYRRLH